MSENNEGVTVNTQPDHGFYDEEIPQGVEPDFDAEDTDEVDETVEDPKELDDPSLTDEPESAPAPTEPTKVDESKNSEPAKPVAASPELNPTSDGTPTVNPPATTAAVPTPPKGGSV